MNCLANTLPIWVTMTADCCTTIDPSCDDEDDDDDDAMPLMVEDVELLVEWLTGAVGRAVVVANLCYHSAGIPLDHDRLFRHLRPQEHLEGAEGQ